MELKKVDILTYDFPDSESARTVCGENDCNIQYIEELFGCRVAVRGNRIEFTDEKIGLIIDRLVRLSSIENSIGQKEILMEFRSMETDQDSSGCAAVSIAIGNKTVWPKTKVQSQYINAMKNSQATIAAGPAGTGKTFLAVSYCLGELLAGRKQKIVLTRPVVEAGESLGFLPGDLSQKLNPYLKPLYDSMEATLPPATVKRLEENGQIEIAPLAYMRGRTINNACIILDEAQNTTKAQMKMFLTRLGENSCAVITGDMTQIDLPKAEYSGLFDAINRLQDVPGVSIVTFDGRDTVRSRIVQRIIKAYEK